MSINNINIIIIIIMFIVVIFLYNFQWNITHYIDNYRFENVIQNTLQNSFIQNLANKHHHPYPDVDFKKNAKILFLTYENRKNLKFVELHNLSIQNYCNKNEGKYDYLFLPFHPSLEKENVYWRKIYLTSIFLNAPQQSYDFIVWLDSDSVIMNSSFDLQSYLSLHPLKHIFMGVDGVIANQGKHVSLNSGFFILRNSNVSRDFLHECIRAHEYDKAYGEILDSALHIVKGTWAGIIYEQGRMNLLLGTSFAKYLKVMDNSVVLNSNNMCNFVDVFVLHLYRQKDEYRCSCFRLMK